MTEPADATPSDTIQSPQTGEATADESNLAGDVPEAGDKQDALLKRIAEREKRYTPVQRETAKALGFLQWSNQFNEKVAHMKVTRREPRPGERLFGGKGSLIPIRKPPAKSSTEPSAKPAAQDQTAPKPEPEGEPPNDPS